LVSKPGIRRDYAALEIHRHCPDDGGMQDHQQLGSSSMASTSPGNFSDTTTEFIAEENEL
jgi:hypothetical protein